MSAASEFAGPGAADADEMMGKRLPGVRVRADKGMYFRAMLMTLISVDDADYGLQT